MFNMNHVNSLLGLELIILTWVPILPWRIQWQSESTHFLDSVKPDLHYLSSVFPGDHLGCPWYFRMSWLPTTSCSVCRPQYPSAKQEIPINPDRSMYRKKILAWVGTNFPFRLIYLFIDSFIHFQVEFLYSPDLTAILLL